MWQTWQTWLPAGPGARWRDAPWAIIRNADAEYPYILRMSNSNHYFIRLKIFPQKAYFIIISLKSIRRSFLCIRRTISDHWGKTPERHIPIKHPKDTLPEAPIKHHKRHPWHHGKSDIKGVVKWQELPNKSANACIYLNVSYCADVLITTLQWHLLLSVSFGTLFLLHQRHV